MGHFFVFALGAFGLLAAPIAVLAALRKTKLYNWFIREPTRKAMAALIQPALEESLITWVPHLVERTVERSVQKALDEKLFRSNGGSSNKDIANRLARIEKHLEIKE